MTKQIVSVIAKKGEYEGTAYDNIYIQYLEDRVVDGLLAGQYVARVKIKNKDFHTLLARHGLQINDLIKLKIDKIYFDQFRNLEEIIFIK